MCYKFSTGSSTNTHTLHKYCDALWGIEISQHPSLVQQVTGAVIRFAAATAISGHFSTTPIPLRVVILRLSHLSSRVRELTLVLWPQEKLHHL